MIFAPERMLRMDVLTLGDDVERIAGLMAREGSVHIIEEPLPASVTTPDPAGAGTVRGAELLRLSGLTDELLHLLDLAPLSVDMATREACLEKGIEQVLAEAAEELNALRDAIGSLFSAREEIERSLEYLDEVSEQMHLLDDHGMSFRSLEGFTHLHAVCGTIERVHTVRLAERLASEPCSFVMRPVQGGSAAFLLIGDPERKEQFDNLLVDAGARVARPPERFVRSFEEGLEQVEIELWEQRDRLAELTRAFEVSRAGWHRTLSEWRTRLQVHGLLNEALARFGGDGTITPVSGYVPVSRRDSLVCRLEQEAAGMYYARFEPVDDATAKQAPTRLRNRRLFRPFELFVKTYGLPGYNDIDPTPFVAVSFLAMFGMMFGDVGHGLVLAAIGAGMAFLPYRALLALRDLGRVLLMAGLSGTFFGFLFGSVFGVEEDSVLRAVWMRPSHPENLTTFLGAGLGLGILVISLGIILNIVQAVRQRNFRKALIGQWSAASLIFFWALLVLFGLRMTGKEIPISAGAAAMVLAVPLFLIAGGQIALHELDKRRRSSGHGEETQAEANEEEGELATILFEPIEIVMNLFTNSVSFLRVAAFGLAHAALTMAVFVVNDMVRVPGANILSLPVEHLFIIVLEGMIVTIQCLRLEYYEFFSKFFVGNGVAYAPLSIHADGNNTE